METIKIPSPSAFLDPPSLSPSRGQSAKKPASKQPSPPSASKQPLGNAITSTGLNKPKQSKSRNGCITCKTKRLKCDETKPTCLQCHKRNVECGGYKKDFKWRPFEESNFVTKSAPRPKKVTTTNTSLSSSAPAHIPNPSAHGSASPAGSGRNTPLTSPSFNHPLPLASPTFGIDGSPPTGSSLPADPLHVSRSSTEFSARTFPEHTSDDIFSTGRDPLQPELGGLGILEPGDDLSDLMFSSPGMDVDGTNQSIPFQIGSMSFSEFLEDENADIEEVVRQSEPGLVIWPPRDATQSQQSSAPAVDATLLFRQPDLGCGSPEMLVVRFDKRTCGILSVKDGASENPWRTAVWPLAKDSPALYHALFALTAFHSSKENPTFRVQGVEHMRKSILYMVQGISNMRTDAALATTLALAFAESWDRHTSTGIQHLRGAKALVSQALRGRARTERHADDLARLRFLYNTWVYMDVIARLTSLDGGGREEIDISPFAMPSNAVHEIDPLMGCASTLFPLIGRAANLIQRVRTSESNSIAIISQAIELKTLIEQWEPPQFFEPPEDPTSDVQHSYQSAQAYRWATLLYLHQAVPEIPSESCADLAKRVLILLATVPLSSRTTIIHIYPLLAASCEADTQEDREWIMERWSAMQNRLMIGNIDRCLEVVREVWSRRDAYEAEKQRRQRRFPARAGSYVAPVDTMKRKSSHGPPMGGDPDVSGFYGLTEPWKKRAVNATGDTPMTLSTPSSRRSSVASPLDNIEFEKTVRGRLHWITVMRDWNWEVLLG
ncbi:transcriptional regulator family: Fungal Specific TF [Paecilomyces variotii]|nr:transcriptional regulator family: Fungal Specific TF [Paecilomyces variotii]